MKVGVCLTAARGSMGVGVSTMVGDSSGDKLGDRSGLLEIKVIDRRRALDDRGGEKELRRVRRRMWSPSCAESKLLRCPSMVMETWESVKVFRVGKRGMRGCRKPKSKYSMELVARDLF